MEFNKCSRCGSFYLSNGNVCPKCSNKDKLEFSTFQNYIEENGLDENLETIASQTGISIKNINRFLTYENYENKAEEANLHKIINKNKIDNEENSKHNNINLY